MSNFYTILTETGLAILTNAHAQGQTIVLAEVAVGDGGGAETTPVEADTELVNEVWRGPVSSLAVHDTNSNWLIIESVLPTDDGGFYVREVGVYDDAGNLIMIGKYPETYKPELAEGSAKDLLIRLIMETTNVDEVNLLIDPSIVMASQVYVNDRMDEHLADTDPHEQYLLESDFTDVMAAHLIHEDPHPQYMTQEEVEALGGGAPNIQVFTASGTYNKPANLVAAKVTVIGGGGGSGAYNDGSAGGCSIKLIGGASIGATEAVTVGGQEQSSSFGAHSSATGGNDEGDPGMGVGGDINLPGGEGDYYSSGNGDDNGGGDSYLCQGGRNNGDGMYGSGSGGNGNGGSGIVIVEEFF